jgi:hypothetical protein
MTTIEEFADKVELILCVERHPHAVGWTASLRAGCACGSPALWLKETMHPPLATGRTAAQSLEQLTYVCRDRTLVIVERERREVYIPADLTA